MAATLHLLLPGDPETRTGGYLYDKRIAEGLRGLGWTVVRHLLPTGFPFPDPAARDAAASLLARLPDGALTLLDGLCLGVLPEEVAAQAGRLCTVGLVHHPLAEETGLPDADRQRLFRLEKAALAQVRRVIVTSPFTIEALRPYQVPGDRIGVVSPGTDSAPLATGSGDGPPHLVCAAALTPRKGHGVLIDALSRLQHLPWRLSCAGSRALAPDTARAVEARILAAGLGVRVALLGELDGPDLDRLYGAADLFVLASHYEGYGMVLAEALARGLPIVATSGGAIPFTVPADAAVLAPPGDPVALAAALESVIGDPARREVLAAGARRARDRLPTWPYAAAAFAAELTRVMGP